MATTRKGRLAVPLPASHTSQRQTAHSLWCCLHGRGPVSRQINISVIPLSSSIIEKQFWFIPTNLSVNSINSSVRYTKYSFLSSSAGLLKISKQKLIFLSVRPSVRPSRGLLISALAASGHSMKGALQLDDSVSDAMDEVTDYFQQLHEVSIPVVIITVW